MKNETEIKKRKLTEFMNTNGYTKIEIQNCLNDEANGNRKLSSELENLIERHGHTEADVMNYFIQRRRKLWIKLMSSDWFSVFLQYLNLKDIAKLDTAFCSHAIRPKWFKLLRSFGIPVEFVNNRLVAKVTDWLVMKNIHPHELSFKYSGAHGSHDVLSEETIFQITQNSLNLKSLSVKNDSPPFTIHEKLLPYTASFCTKLECLKMNKVNVPENGIYILSRTCHNLKHIAFIDVICTGIDQLLKVNPDIISLNLRPTAENSPTIIVGDMLEILGLHCPLLQKCLLKQMTVEVTDIQIETFTKGCPKL